ncbi:MAG: GHMP kinase [Olpidium bornovanus]|uniref:GHMP kinase n=1 Tax=Olpidium bornovanus TaxID=278681 RepID=A0A8H7ZQP6_9FUNG|nr:MAG: GHMP kinase [Olpidium bornovanus]
MDQTVSICSIPNYALHVEFQPALRPTPIPLPVTEPPLVFVIADTLVVSNKLTSAPMCYNLRVVETRAAALALAKALDLSVEQHGELSTLREVCVAYFSTRASQNELAAETVGLWKSMLEEMMKLVELHIRKKEGYTKEEMIEATGVADFESRYMTQFPVRADVFHLYSRAKHVFSEALRVYEFRDTCEKCAGRDDEGTLFGKEVLQKLGSLMNMSQKSCRDDFDCSCPEINELVDHCRLAGSLGSRLTGAGWGGCTVSLVPETIVADFIEKVKDAYYRPRGLSEEVINGAIFATRPGSGAAVMKF